MIIGCAGMFLYCAACVAFTKRRHIPVWLGAGLSWVAWFAATLSDLVNVIAKPAVIIGASLATAAAFLARRDYENTLRFATAVPVAAGAAKLLKYAVDEHRPRLFDRHPEQSFPSGHSVAISAFATSVVLASRRWWTVPIAAVAIATVNVARIAKREHWAKDVIAGDVIGLAGAGLAAAAAYALQRRVLGARPRVAERGRGLVDARAPMQAPERGA